MNEKQVTKKIYEHVNDICNKYSDDIYYSSGDVIERDFKVKKGEIEVRYSNFYADIVIYNGEIIPYNQELAIECKDDNSTNQRAGIAQCLFYQIEGVSSCLACYNIDDRIRKMIKVLPIACYNIKSTGNIEVIDSDIVNNFTYERLHDKSCTFPII